MELESTCNDVLGLAREANSAGAAGLSLFLYLDGRSGARFNNSRLSTSSETWKMCDDKKELVPNEPTPSVLNSVYFGRFEGLDDDGVEESGYYADVKVDDPTDGDSLSDSGVLHGRPKSGERSAERRQKPRAFGENKRLQGLCECDHVT